MFSYLPHTHAESHSHSHQSMHTGPSRDRSGQGPIRLAREGATGNSGKYWVGLGWRREIISGPCSRYPKTKHTLGEKATVVMYQSQVPMRQAPCTRRGPAASARYPMGLPVYILPYRIHGRCAPRSAAPSPVLGYQHGGHPPSPGAVLRCRCAHRSQLGTSPP